MKRNYTYYTIIGSCIFALIAGCGKRNNNSTMPRIERSPGWGIVKAEEKEAEGLRNDTGCALRAKGNVYGENKPGGIVSWWIRRI